jgi:Signal transduction histidine kinase
MTIKTKLLVIVLVIVLLPLISGGLLIAYQRFTAGTSYSFLLMESVQNVSRRVQLFLDSGNYDAFSKLPDGTEIVIKSDDGRILFQNPTTLDISAFGKDTKHDYHMFRFSSKSGSGTVYLSYPSSDVKTRDLYGLPFKIVFAIIILFIIGTALGILKGLDVSIRKLENATKKIASGDLDFPADEFITSDLASLGQALDQMRIQLKEDRERRDRFIMGVSHDLKTPLAGIQGYTAALRDGMADTPEKQQAYYKIIADKASILEGRLGHLINLAKVTTNEWYQTLEEQDLNSFLEETGRSLAEYASFHGFFLEIKNELPKPCPLLFDKDMIRRVFENLVSNALAYGDKTIPVLIHGRRVSDSETLEIIVENGGTPIPPEHRDKLFEPFFRGDRSRNSSGFGLGLASVKSIIESHGWTINLDTQAMNRTRFVIQIP